jgi:hypothetical protein
MPCEFDCEDCGNRVFHATLAAPPIPPLCSTCALMRTMPPEERQKFKDILDTIQRGRIVRKLAREAGLHA